MYAVLWRMLPGPTAAKVVQALLLALAVVAVCFMWLFPALAPHLPFTQTTVDTGATGISSTWRTP